MNVAILYYATPNVKKDKFRLLSGGAVVAIVLVVWSRSAVPIISTRSPTSARPTAPSPGVIGGLLSIWLANMALLIGAEVDAELTRARQLQAGLPAEAGVQLPPGATAG